MTSPTTIAVGDLLQRFRLMAGLTQEQLAERAELSVRGISDIERGLKPRPHHDTVVRLADALGLAPHQRAMFENAAGGRFARKIDRRHEGATGNNVRRPGRTIEQDTYSAIRHNLPSHLSSFVGRAAEIADVTRLLRTARLVTLTGSGGCGKSRLATQVGATLRGEYPDGVWLIELAPLAQADLIQEAVAGVLGVREVPNQPLLETLVRHARTEDLLLILDNCEHLIDGCARFAEVLLTACPSVRILATSREALRIPGEVVYRVPSLPVPPTSTAVTPVQLPEYGATELFVERARSAQTGFTVDERNAATIARICERLDGMPLAIELAAARVRVLSAAQILAGLDDRFRVLTQGSRTALPRQQTLRASVDWSYSLLTEPEQVVFRRLAVFVGGFRLEAAEAVLRQVSGVGFRVSGDDVSALSPDTRNPTPDSSYPTPDTPLDVLDRLGALVDKSLVVADRGGTETHFHLLETIRAYALERLVESGERTSTERAHASWFVGFAEDAMRELRGPKRPGWTTRLEQEQGNLRAAIEWATATGDAPVGLRLGAALWRFWINRGAYAEGRAHLARLLALPRGASPGAERANALTAAGVLAREQGDLAAAQAHHEEALAIRRQLGDGPGVAAALNTLGLVAERRGDFAAARVLYEETLRLSREHGDQVLIAYALGNLGIMATNQGDYERASALIEECLAICRLIHDTSAIANSALELGRIAAAVGNVELARARFSEGFALMEEIGDQTAVAYAFRPLATVLARHGELKPALVLWGAYAAWRESAGVELLPAEQTALDAEIAATREALGEAAIAAWDTGQAMTLKQAAEYALGTDLR
jgi:non-specific serine/threonine protein kinase